MTDRRLPELAPLLIVALLAAPSTGAAVELIDESGFTLKSNLWGGMEFGAAPGPVEGRDVQDVAASVMPFETNLWLARANLRVDAFDIVHAFAQLDAAGGEVRVLDLMVGFAPFAGFEVQAGRYKNPTSATFMIPAPGLVLAHRAQFVSYVPRRLTGSSVRSSWTFGPLEYEANAGVFLEDDKRLWTLSPQLDPARPPVLTGAVDVKVLEKLIVHAGVASSASAAARSLAAPDPRLRQPLVDLALGYHHGALLLDAEGMAIPLHPVAPVYGALASASYRLGRADDLSVRPKLSYDFLHDVTGDNHRVTSGVNLAYKERLAVVRLDVELAHRSLEGFVPAAFVGFQVGI